MTAPMESVKPEEPEEIQQEQLESQEVDGEWGRQRFPTTLTF